MTTALHVGPYRAGKVPRTMSTASRAEAMPRRLTNSMRSERTRLQCVVGGSFALMYLAEASCTLDDARRIVHASQNCYT